MFATTISFYRRLNWDKQDAHLAREVGVSRERIRQMRRELDMPNALNHKHHPVRMGETAYSYLLRPHLRMSGKATAKELLALIDKEPTRLNKSKLHEACRYIGFEVKREPCWFEKCDINWDLSSRDIDRIWKLSTNTAANTRCRYKMAAPLWDSRFSGHDNDHAYLAAVENEEAKAASR